MISLGIEVKVQPEGRRSVYTVISEMVALANRLTLAVSADIHGVWTCARPGDAPLELLDAWAKAIEGAIRAATQTTRGSHADSR